MNKYKIVYQTSDGFEDEVYVYAVNRIAAFMVFEDLGYEDVVNADCFRVLDDEEEAEE